MNASSLERGGFAALLFILILSGCTTGKLWETEQFARYREPAGYSDLRLYHDARRTDLLVLYTEQVEGTEKRRPRAFLLNENLRRIADCKKPFFVATKAARGRVPVPVFSAFAMPPDHATNEFYAVTGTNAWGFSLYSRDNVVGNFNLPTYATARGRTMQVLLTPAAMVADATIVGGCLGILWLEVGAPGIY